MQIVEPIFGAFFGGAMVGVVVAISSARSPRRALGVAFVAIVIGSFVGYRHDLSWFAGARARRNIPSWSEMERWSKLTARQQNQERFFVGVGAALGVGCGAGASALAGWRRERRRRRPPGVRWDDFAGASRPASRVDHAD